jgi:predicted nucleotidyltransferase component of viral defense system
MGPSPTDRAKNGTKRHVIANMKGLPLAATITAANKHEEILCEKVRAILARRVQKLRDFYDLFMPSKHGYKIEDLAKEIVEKVRASL